MSEVQTIPAKYIYLDVVGFTHNRSVEAQADIVHTVNKIVEKSLKEIPKDQLILLPTGDGLCIALLNIEHPYDIHIQIALKIVKGVHNHSEQTEDEKRKFQVRIGINANVDNLVTDINDNRNIAGAGISMAARIMNVADGNQILVGETVYDILRQREQYLENFKHYRATVKHGATLNVYHLIDKDKIGLNIETPTKFVVTETKEKEPRLTRFTAYYFAHAIKNREFFLSKKSDPDAVSTVLLYCLAKDSVSNHIVDETETAHYTTYGAEDNLNIEEQYKYYDSVDFSLIQNFEALIYENHLVPYGEYLEQRYLKRQFIKKEGVKKLKQEWPDIYKKFGLHKLSKHKK